MSEVIKHHTLANVEIWWQWIFKRKLIACLFLKSHFIISISYFKQFVISMEENLSCSWHFAIYTSPWLHTLITMITDKPLLTCGSQTFQHEGPLNWPTLDHGPPCDKIFFKCMKLMSKIVIHYIVALLMDGIAVIIHTHFFLGTPCNPVIDTWVPQTPLWESWLYTTPLTFLMQNKNILLVSA